MGALQYCLTWNIGYVEILFYTLETLWNVLNYLKGTRDSLLEREDRAFYLATWANVGQNCDNVGTTLLWAIK